jgi:hypothetical protein
MSSNALTSTIAAVQALLQQNNLNTSTNSATLAAAALQAASTLQQKQEAKNNSNNAAALQLLLGKNLGGLDANLINLLTSGLTNANINSPTKQEHQQAPKRTYNKKKQAALKEDAHAKSSDNENLLSNAAALMAVLNATNGGGVNDSTALNIEMLSNIKKPRSIDLKSISPNSHATSTYSDSDGISETHSSTDIKINDSKGHLDSIKNEYEEMDDEDDMDEEIPGSQNENSQNNRDQQNTSHNNNENFDQTYEDEDGTFDCSQKERHHSVSSPNRSSSSQTHSRSCSPNSDYNHNDNSTTFSQNENVDSAALLAAQSLVSNPSQTSSLLNGSTDLTSLSFLSEAATAAALINQPNSVAALVATRKRRNEKEAAERVKKIKSVPAEKKDDTYWERRRKNNEAAKRSRDLRRQKEDEIANRASFLEAENLKLKAQITILKAELSKLHFMLYNR